MLDFANRKYLVVLATLMLVVAGCGKKETTSFNDPDGLLRYVPADTPYFVGMLEPSPDEVFDKMGPYIEEMLVNYTQMLDELETMLEESDEWETEDEADKEMVSAILRVIKPMMSPDGLASAGFSRQSTSVIYGNGLLPVMRITVTDSALLEAWVSGIEAEAGTEMATGALNGKVYRYLDAEEMLTKEAEKMDAVFIATPDFWHAPHTVMALEAGFHVYCEKMMSNTIEGAREMVAAADRTGKLCQIGHQRRSNPRYLYTLYELIRKQKLFGDIINANAQWNRALSSSQDINVKPSMLPAAAPCG